MGTLIDKTGQVFGGLTVLRREGSNNQGAAKWRCLCECGEETCISTGDLQSGNTTSCGCRARKALSDRRKTHGESKNTPEYRSWLHMRERCSNSASKDYPDYGGRGIAVCPAWVNDYSAFLKDMGRRPTAKHSLDRFPDTNGDYEPRNCRWATPSQQVNNRRATLYLTAWGQTQLLAVWAHQLGLKYATLYARVYVYALPTEKCLAGWSPWGEAFPVDA